MYEGKDGRIYLEYGRGARYQIFDECGNPTVVVQIAAVKNEGTEKYDLIFEDGQSERASRFPYTLEQLNRYFEAGSAEEIDGGEPIEAPLKKGEVMIYYDRMKRLKERSRKAAETDLLQRDKHGQSEYEQILIRQKNLENCIADKIAAGEEVGIDLKTEYAEVIAKRRELIERNGYSISIYQSSECPICLDTGIDGKDRICTCARAREQEIKSYFAKERLKKRLSENWANLSRGKAEELPELLGKEIRALK